MGKSYPISFDSSPFYWYSDDFLWEIALNQSAYFQLGWLKLDWTTAQLRLEAVKNVDSYPFLIFQTWFVT